MGPPDGRLPRPDRGGVPRRDRGDQPPAHHGDDDPSPTLTSTIHSPTSLGDITLTFRSLLPAPGVDATVGVRENITALFDERRISIQALQPTDGEVGRAISSALGRLALRFTAGALLAMVLALGVLAYGRRRRPTGHHVVAAGLAVTTAVLGTGQVLGK